MDDGDEIPIWYADAILGARLNLYKGLGVFAEYTHYIAYKIKPSITVGLSFSRIASSNRAAPQFIHYRPTITAEELNKVKLAYQDTGREIERRGRSIEITNLSERRAFINKFRQHITLRLLLQEMPSLNGII